MVLADTFQITEDDDSMDAVIFPQNNQRILRQNGIPINVVVGNPPYSVGQTSANDLNANVKYPTLDGRIENTYLRRGGGSARASIYDSYIRAFRWATDRIGTAGIVAFVSNGGWIDSNSADGIRLSVADEYARIYVYNLRGNQRTAGELSRQEGGKVFGAGSRNTVAIFVGVKNPAHAEPCEIFYRDIGDYLSREEKLRTVAQGSLGTVDWTPITPNTHGDWLNQRSDDFQMWPTIGSSRSNPLVVSVFEKPSAGLKTNRDAWVYSFGRPRVAANVDRFIDVYSMAVRDISTAAACSNDITASYSEISWSTRLRGLLSKQHAISLRQGGFRVGIYRPFCRQHLYFDPDLNEARSLLPTIFPTEHHSNVGIYVVGSGSDVPFSALMLDLLPNLHVTGAGSGGQFFPRWTYEKLEPMAGGFDFATVDESEVDEWGYRRVDNITDGVLALYHKAIGDFVTKDDIFHYVYGLLHDPAYRQTYAADLKKVVPRIPITESRERFAHLATSGRALANMHVGYESAEPYRLDVQIKSGTNLKDRETWRVQKMKWASKSDRSAIIYNARVTVAGIPEVANRYLLGSRSALDWLIDRYQVTTDKAFGIVNDPNDWCDEHDDPTYIVDLIKKITTVSVETMKIVDGLAMVAADGSPTTGVV
jgi:predicted helicase